MAIGIGPSGTFNRPGYDQWGNFTGSNQDLVNSGSYYYDKDGALVANNSGAWQSQGYAPGQTAFTNGNYQPGGGWGGQAGTWGGQPAPGANPLTPTYPAQSGTTAATQGYTPPPAAPNSATAQNPFLNLGLNAFTNTQQGFDTSWLDNLSKTLYSQANQNWEDNLQPSLNSAAMAAGGYGGDRAALSKGVVMDRMNQNVMNAMAPQYAGAYESSLNRALQGGQAAAGVGQNLEQLDLNRMLGLGGLSNQTRGLDATIANNAGDMALREMLGLGGLNINQQQVDNQTAQIAANSAGVPTYTNPWAAGVGGAAGIAQLLNLIYGQG